MKHGRHLTDTPWKKGIWWFLLAVFSILLLFFYSCYEKGRMYGLYSNDYRWIENQLQSAVSDYYSVRVLQAVQEENDLESVEIPERFVYEIYESDEPYEEQWLYGPAGNTYETRAYAWDAELDGLTEEVIDSTVIGNDFMVGSVQNKPQNTHSYYGMLASNGYYYQPEEENFLDPLSEDFMMSGDIYMVNSSQVLSVLRFYYVMDEQRLYAISGGILYPLTDQDLFFITEDEVFLTAEEWNETGDEDFSGISGVYLNRYGIEIPIWKILSLSSLEGSDRTVIEDEFSDQYLSEGKGVTYDLELYEGSTYKYVEVRSYLDSSLSSEGDLYDEAEKLAARLWKQRYLYPLFTLICLGGALFSTLCLCLGTGYRRGEDGLPVPDRSLISRFPADLCVVLSLLLIYFGVFAMFQYSPSYLSKESIKYGLVYGYPPSFLKYELWFLCAVVLPINLCLLNVIGNRRAGILGENTILHRFGRLLKLIQASMSEGRMGLNNWYHILLAFGLFTVTEIVFYLLFIEISWNPTGILIVYILSHLLLLCAIIWTMLQGARVKQGAKRMEEGGFTTQIELNKLTGDFRDHAETLNHIADGISEAVAEKTKSERLRTELITNVSHDIKTPLTSIISYVDLLQYHGDDPETRKEYLEVLQRQSGKLKKLIEDMLEASKASTGNIRMDLMSLDLREFLHQVLAEYDGKFKAAMLEPVISEKTEEISRVTADSRHLWRVVDNLLGNACKYGQPSTRFYIDLTQDEKTVKISFRNISKAKLNISSEELMERFVRGDSSRNTEGSGLGLSIAQSLTELMGGKLILEIDGDLFKAELSLPKAEYPE